MSTKSDMADSQALFTQLLTHIQEHSVKKRREHNIIIIKKGGKTNGGIITLPVPPLSHAELSPWGHTYFGYYDQNEVVPPKILPKLPSCFQNLRRMGVTLEDNLAR